MPEETTPAPDPNALTDAAFEGIKHSGDPLDKKLFHFVYSGSASSHDWEKENPIAVPREILEAYPGMRFRYRAEDPKTGHLRKGDHYDGWQVFKDGSHPDGLRFGGDLILAAMPIEMAESRNRAYREESSQLVRGMQEEQIAAVERAAVDLGDDADFRSLPPGSQVGGSAPIGIVVGVSKSTNRETGEKRLQYRGYHPEQVEEMTRKAAEERAKHRTTRSYSIPNR